MNYEEAAQRALQRQIESMENMENIATEEELREEEAAEKRHNKMILKEIEERKKGFKLKDMAKIRRKKRGYYCPCK